MIIDHFDSLLDARAYANEQKKADSHFYTDQSNVQKGNLLITV